MQLTFGTGLGPLLSAATRLVSTLLLLWGALAPVGALAGDEGAESLDTDTHETFFSVTPGDRHPYQKAARRAVLADAFVAGGLALGVGGIYLTENRPWLGISAGLVGFGTAVASTHYLISSVATGTDVLTKLKLRRKPYALIIGAAMYYASVVGGGAVVPASEFDLGLAVFFLGLGVTGGIIGANTQLLSNQLAWRRYRRSHPSRFASLGLGTGGTGHTLTLVFRLS